MSNTLCKLCYWTKESIAHECKSSYRAYEGAVIDHYTRYFAARPHLRCPKQRYSARTVSAALPPGLGQLQHLIPPQHFHRYARSGRSSQTLALAILGAAAIRDPTLAWFWQAIGLLNLCGPDSRNLLRFEHALEPTDLGEYPRVTKLDLSVSNSAAFAAIETKWSEPGLGICSCLKDGDGNPAAGHYCASRVAGRSKYWRVAHENFGFERERLPLLPCGVSVAYQAVRSIAAARHLAGRRKAAFVLLFDDANPYFSKTGRWPGWPAILEATLADGWGLSYRAISWRKLIPRLPLSSEILDWTESKHRLRVDGLRLLKQPRR